MAAYGNSSPEQINAASKIRQTLIKSVVDYYAKQQASDKDAKEYVEDLSKVHGGQHRPGLIS